MTQNKTALISASVTRRTVARRPGMYFVADQYETLAVTQAERHAMVEVLAYRMAEQRGFCDDRALEDWLQAEAVVDAMFSLQ